MQEALERSETSIREEALAFVCSPEQRRLWVLHELDSHHPGLHLARCWRIEGKLTHAHLEKVFRAMVLRHAALRTGFVRRLDEPVQSVRAQVSFQIPVIDLSALPEGDGLAEAQRIARLEAAAPFDISAPPLIRVTHLRLSDVLGFLLITAHRLICDEASIAILVREIAESCAALQSGKTPMSARFTTRYADFATWQAQRLASEQAHVDVEYWRPILAGVKYFEMPLDHPRPALPSADVRMQSILLDTDVSAALVNVSRANGSSLSVTLLTGLLGLLNRYSGETDIAVGGQFSGRDEAGFDLDELVGPFSHTLLLRQDLSDDPSFAALLARVQETVQQALQHRYLDIEKLIEIVHPARDGSRNTLVSVNYYFQENYLARAEFGDLKFSDHTSSPAAAWYDLSFIVLPDTLGWRMVCEYNGALFEDQTIGRLLKHFNQLLRSAATSPEKKISSLTLLDDDEVRLLTIDSNRTAVPYPRHLTVPQLFMRQAERSPDATAVVCGERSLTYRQLDAASNRLALLLQKRGLAPASRICIFLDRSPDLMVALLAILKAGSAYIPLDPVYPAERLQHVFDNSRPAAVITRSALRDRLPPGEATILVLDKETELTTAQTMRPLSHLPSPSDPAYLIYTSGSTGRPKGVQIPHQALVNLLWSMRSQPGIGSADTVVSVTTIAFDLVVPDLFLPLICGAKLVFAPESVVADGRALLQLLQQHAATWMQATPVTWQLLLEAGWCGNPALKAMCGGEAMTRVLADSLLACGNELWNMYGPTETTVWSAVLRVEKGDGPVPLGPPISNTQFYILDAHGNLAPPGAPGELYIGGDGVALGYFDRPDLTRERFVPDPFRAIPEAKLYRTGDIVRMRAPGHFEYLGRADHQVKLRGFRIELGEIEAVLLQHPDIVEAVAVLGKDPSGQGALWAYAVPRGFDAQQSERLGDDLRARLAQSLPGYMRPSSLMLLEALPRTPNGKIDRRSLPAPATVPGKEPTLPSNDIEARLARIWTGLLRLENVDTGADFFDLGGNSLLAARLMIGIEAEFGKRLSLAALFQAPTIALQAKLLENNDAREYDFRQVVRLQPNGTKTPLIAIHNTGVYYYHLSKRLSSEQPLIALQLFDPSIPRDKLPQSLEEIAAEYVQLIRQFQPSGPYALLGWCVGGVLAFEVARQLAQQNQEIKLLALIDSWAPGHLSRLSKLRARLSDYSYRWQLILADWRRVTNYRQGVRDFLTKRTIVKKILRRLGHPVAESGPVVFEDRNINVENYDQWLLGYLDNVALRYTPKPYAGKLTLLCSATEPRGLFLDPKMGWGSFASTIDIAIIDGDHFTMFQGKGLQQMAEHIATAVAAYGDRRKEKAH